MYQRHFKKGGDEREQIRLAQADLDGLFHNRRVNAAVAPMFIGLMPSAGAMLLCGEIVREATDSYLERKDQAVLTSWFRHIPESTLPTYAGVLLMAQLSKVPMGEYLLGMIVPNITMIALGWFFFLRKLPKDPGTPPSSKRVRDAADGAADVYGACLHAALAHPCLPACGGRGFSGDAGAADPKDRATVAVLPRADAAVLSSSAVPCGLKRSNEAAKSRDFGRGIFPAGKMQLPVI
ncbi:MAG: DUF401 family protein [Oscillospiraceae bacterium]|nr:DUF401 family protein [Oscillospiraceae bacterium]